MVTPYSRRHNSKSTSANKRLLLINHFICPSRSFPSTSRLKSVFLDPNSTSQKNRFHNPDCNHEPRGDREALLAVLVEILKTIQITAVVLRYKGNFPKANTIKR